MQVSVGRFNKNLALVFRINPALQVFDLFCFVILFDRQVAIERKVLAVHPDVYVAEFGSNFTWYNNKDFDFIVAHGLRGDWRSRFTILDSAWVEDHEQNYSFMVYKTGKFYYPAGAYDHKNR